MTQRTTQYGFDAAAAFVLAGRAWALLSRPVTVALIVTRMTPEVQGFYYTFSSVLGISVFFELGVGVVLTQFYSHETAYFRVSADGAFEGNEQNIQRFSSILQQGFRWYCGIGLLVIAVVGPAGMLVFTRQPLTNVHWLGAWWGFVILSALAAPIQPFLSAVDGLGLVSQTRAVILVADAIGSIGLWIALVTGLQLFAIWLVPAATFSTGFVFIIARFPFLIRRALSRDTATHRVKWRDELWPMQWKIAISWISGYFIFRLFTPVLFYFHGATAAGQMGLALAITSALASITAALVGTKAPTFARLIAGREFRRLDSLFFRAATTSAVLTFAASVLGFIIVLSISKSAYGLRFLPMWQMAALFVVGALNSIVAAQATYLRAHKQEPFLWLSVVAGLLIGSGAILGGMWFSSGGQVIVFLFTTLCISSPWAVVIFRRSRTEWHRPIADSSELAECRGPGVAANVDD